uniref:Uncharacterized protein n=1 Tax=Candidatus Kentrum sp. TC TaxID=2126339 RepID=A0A450ZK03_9GAMM|nr:MAG: hypothetical protein BECKTC1821F_GA0114240_100416 [Candidatus Kentron sp. TC]
MPEDRKTLNLKPIKPFVALLFFALSLSYTTFIFDADSWDWGLLIKRKPFFHHSAIVIVSDAETKKSRSFLGDVAFVLSMHKLYCGSIMPEFNTGNCKQKELTDFSTYLRFYE